MGKQVVIEPSAQSQSANMLKAMVGIGAICAFFIVLTYELTGPRIAKLKAEALKNAVVSVLPASTVSTVGWGLNDSKITTLPAGDENVILYAGYDASGDLTGLAIKASGMGYADKIKFLYGYDPEKEVVTGLFVLDSKETPGLGDKIEKSEDFLQNFEALNVKLHADKSSLINPVQTVKGGNKEFDWQIDGITGATISSRTIGDAINKSAGELLPVIQENRELLKKGGGQ